MDMVAIILRFVELDQELRRLHTIVMLLAGFDGAGPGKERIGLQAAELFINTRFTNLSTTSHEFAHQWGSYFDWSRLAGIRPAGSTPSHDPLWTQGETLIGAVIRPWRRALQTDTGWQVGLTPAPAKLHPYTLYAMGLLPRDSVPPVDVQFDPEQLARVATPTRPPWDDLKAAGGAGLSARGVWKPGLSERGVHGASFAEVEVDIETGKIRVTKMCHVQDCGLPLNRLALESQINGGMIQSIGFALYEGRVMDGTLGVMVNPAFNDYKIPGTMEMPEFIPIIDDGDTRNVVMGIAEPANIPGCAAIANAVYNACGVRVRTTPITPDKILNGLVALRKGNKV